MKKLPLLILLVLSISCSEENAGVPVTPSAQTGSAQNVWMERRRPQQAPGPVQAMEGVDYWICKNN